MAKSIDIKKTESAGCSYYEPLAERVAYTYIGRLKGVTDFGKEALRLRVPFCTMFRGVLKAKQLGGELNKSELQTKYELPGRMVNTAFLYAEAMIKSAVECQKEDLEQTERDIQRQVHEVFWSESRQLAGRVSKLKRLYKKRKGLLVQVGKPSIHIGRKEYQNQLKAGWKAAYEVARNDRIGCLGSADELGGNSTFKVKADPLTSGFNLYHEARLVGKFNLQKAEALELNAILAINHVPFKFSMEIATQGKNKGKLVKRKITTGRVPLTLWLIKGEDDSRFWVHVSYFKDKVLPAYAPVCAIGVDLNTDSIASNRVHFVDGGLKLDWAKPLFDPEMSKTEKATWIYEVINGLVAEAKARNYMIVLEYLDFEGSKRWLRTKLGAMLRIMPYRKIRQAFERRCMEEGVILRYVNPSYTSLLGAVLTEYPNLGRDEAAAAVIALRATEEGNAWLEARCAELAKAERCKIRINRKSQFGCTVQVDGGLIPRQSEHGAQKYRGTAAHTRQNLAGRAISELSKAMGGYLYQRGVVPVCWKGSVDGWSTAPPNTTKACRHAQREAPLQKTQNWSNFVLCSSLINLV